MITSHWQTWIKIEMAVTTVVSLILKNAEKQTKNINSTGSESIHFGDLATECPSSEALSWQLPQWRKP